MNDRPDERFAPGGRALAAALVLGVAWVAWGLVRHPGFQPAHVIRIAAPIVALVVGAAFHLANVCLFGLAIDGLNHATPSFFCKLVEDVVYWKTNRLSG